MKDKESNDNSSSDFLLKAVALLLVIVAGFFLLSEKANEVVSPAASSATLKERPYSLDRVNDHILFTNDNIEIERLKAEQEIRQISPTLDKTVKQRDYSPTQVLSLDHDQSAEIVAKDLGRKGVEATGPSTPHEIIQSHIYQQEKLAEQTQEYYERKRQQITENARAKGYEIELDEKGERILKWRRIKRSGASEKFSNGTGSSAR